MTKIKKLKLLNDKNKETKIKLIISLIILALDIISWFSFDYSIKNTDISESIFLFLIWLLCAPVIFITGGTICLIWLIYGIIILLRKIKTGQFKHKNFLIIGIIFIIIILITLLYVWLYKKY